MRGEPTNETFHSVARPSIKKHAFDRIMLTFNPLNTELNPICHLLVLLGAHHILHVSRIRVKEIQRIRRNQDLVIHSIISGA